MKNLAFLFALFLFFGCSDDDSEDTVDPNNTYLEYANAPNSEGQLLSEIYVDSDNATTYVYGTADAFGAPLQVESFAYRVENSNKTEFILLDSNQRVSMLYSETNGIKDNIVHSFSYPEEGLVNYIVYDRNWTSMEDTVVNFSTVEVDGDNFTGYNLLRGTNGIEWTAVSGWLGVCAGVAGAAILVVTAPTAFAGVLAAVIFAGVASASEPPVAITNPDAPNTPDITLIENQCNDSNLEVIIGVDPGNLLVAIVNGDSADYDFYWSTGETDTGLISDSIIAPEDGNYYLMVVDENGCVAFGSATIGPVEPVDPQLLLNTWYLVGETENDEDTFNIEACNIIIEFTETQLISTEYYGESCENADGYTSNYEITDNIIIETAEGQSSIITVLELTPYKLVLEEIDGDYVFVEIYTNIYGSWTITENSDCVSSNGDTFTDNGTSSLTLNNNDTVVLDDDSNGNYLSNEFTFENGILAINVSYQDFFSPECGGVNFQTATNAMTLTYDNATNTFSGTSQASRNDVSGSGCNQYGNNCNGTVTLTR
jgi:hypothetical protein